MSLRMMAQTMLIFGLPAARSREAKWRKWRVVFDGYQRRHIEGLAQVTVALFTQASVATHGGAAFVRVVEPDRHERQPAERAPLDRVAPSRPKG